MNFRHFSIMSTLRKLLSKLKHVQYYFPSSIFPTSTSESGRGCDSSSGPGSTKEGAGASATASSEAPSSASKLGIAAGAASATAAMAGAAAALAGAASTLTTELSASSSSETPATPCPVGSPGVACGCMLSGGNGFGGAASTISPLANLLTTSWYTLALGRITRSAGHSVEVTTQVLRAPVVPSVRNATLRHIDRLPKLPNANECVVEALGEEGVRQIRHQSLLTRQVYELERMRGCGRWELNANVIM
mmetsp:Transcript_23088/g.54729  ORF Transcript_23088/g.54729 Transcript_23088/m.54729 type:complete len:248 (+) Transcript_23088:70-813(+)